jgi:hypothetical protein
MRHEDHRRFRAQKARLEVVFRDVLENAYDRRLAGTQAFGRRSRCKPRRSLDTVCRNLGADRNLPSATLPPSSNRSPLGSCVGSVRVAFLILKVHLPFADHVKRSTCRRVRSPPRHAHATQRMRSTRTTLLMVDLSLQSPWIARLLSASTTCLHACGGRVLWRYHDLVRAGGPVSAIAYGVTSLTSICPLERSSAYTTAV